ncbi:MAG: DNA replication and repair protein RecF [Akkermansia sp.]|nr:DNA replication and repair protein RecF [Akkermansia sp.]
MLRTLRLRHFRCYKALNWEIPAEGALLMGNNAEGKTSLMESLCFALTLHSPRAHKLDRLTMHEQNEFGISLTTQESTRRITWQQRKLNLQINGAPCKDYNDYLADAPPVVWLGNGDIALVTGGADERRSYLDFLGSQWHPAYRSALREYKKALKSRNLLLRNPRRSAATLRSYAAVLCRYGEIIVNLRRQLLALLHPHICDYHARISGGVERVTIHYEPSTNLPLSQAIEQSIANDERLGYTTIGPHRDDFSLHIEGTPAADFGSEGQQRTLATALILAQAGLLLVETGHSPILFIDDIFGELDPNRRKSLLELLPSESQIFITTTHLDWLGSHTPPLPVINISDIRKGIA